MEIINSRNSMLPNKITTFCYYLSCSPGYFQGRCMSIGRWGDCSLRDPSVHLFLTPHLVTQVGAPTLWTSAIESFVPMNQFLNASRCITVRDPVIVTWTSLPGDSDAVQKAFPAHLQTPSTVAPATDQPSAPSPTHSPLLWEPPSLHIYPRFLQPDFTNRSAFSIRKKR